MGGRHCFSSEVSGCFQADGDFQAAPRVCRNPRQAVFSGQDFWMTQLTCIGMNARVFWMFLHAFGHEKVILARLRKLGGLRDLVQNGTSSVSWPAQYWWTFLLIGAGECKSGSYGYRVPAANPEIDWSCRMSRRLIYFCLYSNIDRSANNWTLKWIWVRPFAPNGHWRTCCLSHGRNHLMVGEKEEVRPESKSAHSFGFWLYSCKKNLFYFGTRQEWWNTFVSCFYGIDEILFPFWPNKKRAGHRPYHLDTALKSWQAEWSGDVPSVERAVAWPFVSIFYQRVEIGVPFASFCYGLKKCCHMLSPFIILFGTSGALWEW